jgi:hypothetical protein
LLAASLDTYLQCLLIISSLYFTIVDILCCMLMCMMQAGENFFGVGGATRINPKGEGVVHTPELNAMVARQIPVLNAMAAGQDPCT